MVSLIPLTSMSFTHLNSKQLMEINLYSAIINEYLDLNRDVRSEYYRLIVGTDDDEGSKELMAPIIRSDDWNEFNEWCLDRDMWMDISENPDDPARPFWPKIVRMYVPETNETLVWMKMAHG